MTLSVRGTPKGTLETCFLVPLGYLVKLNNNYSFILCYSVP